MAKASKAGRKKRRRRTGAWRYAIGIGSNQPLSRSLGPRAIVAAAMAALDRLSFRLIARPPITASRPGRPSRRRHATAVALTETDEEPMEVLGHLQMLERAARRRRARRWGARTLDLDVLLWTGGMFAAPRLSIPPPPFPARRLVLGPPRAGGRGGGG